MRSLRATGLLEDVSAPLQKAPLVLRLLGAEIEKIALVDNDHAGGPGDHPDHQQSGWQGR